MKFLVTGGAGFIGSHVTELLLAQGHSVTILDNLSTGKRKNLKGFKVDFIEGDIQDAAAVSRALKDADGVIHLAAQVSVIRSLEAPKETHSVNAEATANLLEAARKANLKSFIFASSCAVYGDAKALPIDESFAPQPLSPYAESKLIGELHCSEFRAAYGLQTCVFRFFNIFGPRQDDASAYSGVIAIFARRLLRNEPITIFGDGTQTRDFLSVKNVAEALVLAAQKPEAFPDPCYNLGSGKPTSIKELFQILSKLAKNKSPCNFAAARQGEIKHSFGTAKLFAERAKTCGHPFSPQDLTAALSTTLEWYATQQA